MEEAGTPSSIDFPLMASSGRAELQPFAVFRGPNRLAFRSLRARRRIFFTSRCRKISAAEVAAFRSGWFDQRGLEQRPSPQGFRGSV
jgi:hypothetical protein